MENKAYIIEKLDSETAKTLRSLTIFETHCHQTITSSYLSFNFEIRKGKGFCYVIVDKQTDGAIVYFSNYRYGLGVFYWLTNKMLDKLLAIQTDEIKEFEPHQWRHFSYYHVIIEVFDNPIHEIAKKISKREREIENAKADLKILQRKQKKYLEL